MKWEIFVGIALLYQYGLVHVAVKKIGASEGSRTRKLVWQFFFAASLAFFTAAVAGRLEMTWPVLIVIAIGAANAFGCYCLWRAYDISMSRAAILSNLDDLIAIGLGYAVLGEWGVLTPALAAGVAISVVSATVFARLKVSHEGEKASRVRLMSWVLGYSSIWGIAMFSMRFFSVQGLHILTFVAAWYAGAWLGALLTRYVIMGQDEAGPPLAPAQRGKVFLLAVSVWTSLMCAYWMRVLVPITVVQPMQLVAEMSIPALIALIFFGEARSASRREILVIVAGILGITLIAIGY